MKQTHYCMFKLMQDSKTNLCSGKSHAALTALLATSFIIWKMHFSDYQLQGPNSGFVSITW